MPALAYIDGIFCSPGDKRICFEDRGYQFGDGIYEVVRIYSGHPYQLQAHLDRLWASAVALGINILQTQTEIAELIRKIATKSQIPEAQVYIQITRGSGPRQHHYPSGVDPVLVMTVRPSPILPSTLWERGGSAITYPEIRWKYCHIKSLNLLPNVMAKEEAVKAGAHEAFFVREDGVVTEGSSTNLFMVKNGIVQTHPAGQSILKGITRGVTLQICERKKLDVLEETFTLEQLLASDEVFITGTISEIMPIVTINGHKIGNGLPGPIAGVFQDAFKKTIREETGNMEVNQLETDY